MFIFPFPLISSVPLDSQMKSFRIRSYVAEVTWIDVSPSTAMFYRKSLDGHHRHRSSRRLRRRRRTKVRSRSVLTSTSNSQRLTLFHLRVLSAKNRGLTFNQGTAPTSLRAHNRHYVR